jgi:hypothetical protein
MQLNAFTFLIRPRSYLIAGHLRVLGNDGGGVHMQKLRSFELYRQNLYEPEIVTFDESSPGPRGALTSLSNRTPG